MLGSLPVLTAAVLAAVQPALGYPGMDKQLAEIVRRDDGPDSTEMIGDLLTLSDSQLTPTGKDIKLILSGGGNPQSSATWAAPSLGSSACQADTCCVWQYIVNDMVGSFRGSSGRCTGLARRAVRLGFHDAAAWSKTTAQQKQPGVCTSTAPSPGVAMTDFRGIAGRRWVHLPHYRGEEVRKRWTPGCL